MSKESIRNLLESKGTFPPEEDVRHNFDTLFSLVEGGQESLSDLVWGFDLALDQWAHIASDLDPLIADRLREWAMSHWISDSYEQVALLGGILVNVSSSAVLSFLRQELVKSSSPELREELQELIADIEYEGDVVSG